MLTDVGGTPVITTGNGDGFGGSGIWAILLLALLGGGGFGCNRGNDTECIDRPMDARFNSLEGMNEFRYMAQVNNINHVENMESQRDNMREICETKNMIQSVGHENALIEKDTQLQTALGFKDAELRQAECCCQQLRATEASKTEILSAIANDKFDRMREKYEDMRLAYSQCQQNNAIISALAPKVAEPAYITMAPGQSYFPPYNAAAYNYGGQNCGGCGSY